MGVVAVLHPQDCLKNKPLTSHPPKMKLPNPNPKPPRTTRTHSNHQKQIHKSDKTSQSNRPASTSNQKPRSQVNKLVMGQVKILKRGEHLTKTTPDREPEKTVEKNSLLVGGLYAGSSMYTVSPPPSSVPLPIFITKKVAAVSEATSDLRKMLRLDFP
ncbi:hypothetical protein SESBI_19907 [Sesbania bispinosa]|nr:hypothetical protein SESBI_19907 [Sesbania bispinosa]